MLPMDPGMPLPPLPPGVAPTNMSPPIGMMIPPEMAGIGELPHRPTPIPASYTPMPGFASAVTYPPDLDPAQLAMPTDAQLAMGDSTAMVPNNGAKIVVIIVVLLLAIAGGVYLVVTTGGKRGGEPAPSGGNNIASAAAMLPADASALAAPPIDDDGGAGGVATGSDGAQPAVTPPADAGAGAGSSTICSVKVTSYPPGADVLVDNAVVAHTPGSIDLPCDVKTKLLFRKLPLIPQTHDVTPKADAETAVRIALVKMTFSLKVSSSPAGAAITVNGKPMGVTPSSVKLTGFEPATIVLTKNGFETYTDTTTPKTNAETFHATLKRRK
jgi:PEGA domain